MSSTPYIVRWRNGYALDVLHFQKLVSKPNFFTGWELHVPSSSAVEVYKTVMAAGKDFGIANAGYRAIDSLSIEKGYRHWHMDLRSEDDPLEAGLGFTCKLKSDVDFLGRKALEEKQRKGLKKRIAVFSIEE